MALPKILSIAMVSCGPLLLFAVRRSEAVRVDVSNMMSEALSTAANASQEGAGTRRAPDEGMAAFDKINAIADHLRAALERSEEQASDAAGNSIIHDKEPMRKVTASDTPIVLATITDLVDRVQSVTESNRAAFGQTHEILVETQQFAEAGRQFLTASSPSVDTECAQSIFSKIAFWRAPVETPNLAETVQQSTSNFNTWVGSQLEAVETAQSNVEAAIAPVEFRADRPRSEENVLLHAQELETNRVRTIEQAMSSVYAVRSEWQKLQEQAKSTVATVKTEMTQCEQTEVDTRLQRIVEVFNAFPRSMLKAEQTLKALTLDRRIQEEMASAVSQLSAAKGSIVRAEAYLKHVTPYAKNALEIAQFLEKSTRKLCGRNIVTKTWHGGESDTFQGAMAALAQIRGLAADTAEKSDAALERLDMIKEAKAATQTTEMDELAALQDVHRMERMRSNWLQKSSRSLQDAMTQLTGVKAQLKALALDEKDCSKSSGEFSLAAVQEKLGELRTVLDLIVPNSAGDSLWAKAVQCFDAGNDPTEAKLSQCA